MTIFGSRTPCFESSRLSPIWPRINPTVPLLCQIWDTVFLQHHYFHYSSNWIQHFWMSRLRPGVILYIVVIELIWGNKKGRKKVLFYFFCLLLKKKPLMIRQSRGYYFQCWIEICDIRKNITKKYSTVTLRCNQTACLTLMENQWRKEKKLYLSWLTWYVVNCIRLGSLGM